MLGGALLVMASACGNDKTTTERVVKIGPGPVAQDGGRREQACTKEHCFYPSIEGTGDLVVGDCVRVTESIDRGAVENIEKTEC